MSAAVIITMLFSNKLKERCLTLVGSRNVPPDNVSNVRRLTCTDPGRKDGTADCAGRRPVQGNTAELTPPSASAGQCANCSASLLRHGMIDGYVNLEGDHQILTRAYYGHRNA